MFIPERDVYYFYDEDIAHACLQHGIAVYTRQEFASTFPMFALTYGAAYHVWTMKLPEDTYVLMAHPSAITSLPPDIRRALLVQQVRCGRGHIYGMEWLEKFGITKPSTIRIDNKSYYFLTWDDWWALSPEIRRQWVLDWLMEWRKEDAEGIGPIDVLGDHDGVPYKLLQGYAGTFGHASTANCFAAAIAMVVGEQSPHQGRVLIDEWLHQGPFFRLLLGQGYEKHSEYRNARDLLFQPCDVLVWYTGDGTAGHAAYAVSDDLVFQKQGQGWDNPWQILRIHDVWYNDYLKTGGYIEIFRRTR